MATSRFARALLRLRFVVPVAWIAAAVAATLLLPSINEAQTGALGDLVPNDAEAIDAEIRAAEQFGFPLLSRTLVVQRDPNGLSTAEQARVATRAIALNRHTIRGIERIGGAIPLTNAIGDAPFVRERSTTAITYLLFAPDVDRHEREGLARGLVQRIEADEDHFVETTGALPARTAQSEAVTDALPLVELATLILVALVVGLHFRSIVAPLVTLIAIAVAYLLSIRLMAAMGEQLGVSVPSEVEPVVVVLLFGVMTDYSIFFLSRFRQRLADGAAPRQAAESTIAELQRIIIAAGLIVALASAALIVAELGFFQAFGPGLALAVLVALAVSVTFVPACLALLGSWIFWPGRPGQDVSREKAQEEPPVENRRVRAGLVGLAVGRPVLTLVVVGGLLLGAASGLTRLDVGQTLIRGLPEDSPPRQAYAAAQSGFAAGILSPTVVLVEGPGIVRDREGLRALQRMVERRGNVAQVVGPRQQRVQRNLGAVYSRSGDAVRLLVVLNSDPLGAPAIQTLAALQRDLPEMIDRAGLQDAKASLAGDTALAAETVTKARSDLDRIAPAVLIVVFGVLAIFLRALVAPLYLVGASVLALAAALGITAYVFGELTFFVPFAAAVLLVSLGSDYNVFLAGRIWDEARTRPLDDAIRVAGARAARAITIAGLVLAGSFALLALVPIRAFEELAFVMAIGLLIDAFLVRTLLVPALMTIVGRVSEWPGRRFAPVAGPDAAKSARCDMQHTPPPADHPSVP